MKETSGYLIYFSGDMSVGILPSSYEITGPFYWDNEENEKLFKEDILTAFENAEDGRGEIISFEDQEEINKMELGNA